MTLTIIPGMVIICRSGRVLMKVVVGRGGHLTEDFAVALREKMIKTGEIPPEPKDVCRLAIRMKFGSKEDRVVITGSRIFYEGSTPGLVELCLKNFENMDFIPLWGPTISNPPVVVINI